MSDIKEGLAREVYDAVFPSADWNEPSEYEKEPFYKKADQIISYLKSQIEKMPSPYKGARLVDEARLVYKLKNGALYDASHLLTAEVAWDKAMRVILNKLQ